MKILCIHNVRTVLVNVSSCNTKIYIDIPEPHIRTATANKLLRVTNCTSPGWPRKLPLQWSSTRS